MQPKKWLTILINLLGGSAVLGSYALGLQSHPGSLEILWSGVPQNIRPIYSADMLLAAAGYLAFTFFILFRINSDDARVAGRFGFGIFNLLYAAILIPSALWMPLTFLAVEKSSLTLLWTVRVVLALVGLSSLGMFIALLTVAPRQPKWTHRIAIIGSMALCLQTVGLDAILWGALFHL